MENSVLHRLKMILVKKSIPMKQISDAAGIGQNTFSRQIAGTSALSENVLSAVAKYFPDANMDWVIKGIGEMFLTEESKEKTDQDEAVVSYKLVPLLNLDAVGGMNSTNKEISTGEYINRLIPFTDAQEDDVALVVSGDSMSPTCPAGSVILVREIKSWREYFGFGNIFVILLKDGRRILKEVARSEEDSKNCILCKSHNSSYPAEDLPKNMINGVWKVIKILNERGW